MNTTIATWVLVLLGQAADAAGSGDSTASVEVKSVLDFVVKGGPMMIPIGLCSLVALTVVIERLVTLRRRNVIPPKFLPGLTKLLGNGVDDKDEALEYCQNNGSPVANVFAAGIRRLGGSVEYVEKHIQDSGQREVLKLRRYMRSLAVIASIAPLMGLLGTIFGMINAFQTVAVSSEALGKAELLAEGIYVAMITTAAGLMVAIPVLIAYHWLLAKIDGLVSEIDQMTVDFVEQYAFPQHAEGKAGPRLRSVDEPEEGDETGTGNKKTKPPAVTR